MPGPIYLSTRHLRVSYYPFWKRRRRKFLPLVHIVNGVLRAFLGPVAIEYSRIPFIPSGKYRWW